MREQCHLSTMFLWLFNRNGILCCVCSTSVAIVIPLTPMSTLLHDSKTLVVALDQFCGVCRSAMPPLLVYASLSYRLQHHTCALHVDAALHKFRHRYASLENSFKFVSMSFMQNPYIVLGRTSYLLVATPFVYQII